MIRGKVITKSKILTTEDVTTGINALDVLLQVDPREILLVSLGTTHNKCHH